MEYAIRCQWETELSDNEIQIFWDWAAVFKKKKINEFLYADTCWRKEVVARFLHTFSGIYRKPYLEQKNSSERIGEYLLRRWSHVRK